MVETAIQLALEGRRAWDPVTVDLGGFLRGIIRSLVSAERKRYVRAKTITSSERVARYAGVTASVEDVVVVAEQDLDVESMVEAAIDGDDVLAKLWAAILDGHTKREDLAEALGWNPATVTAARIKLKRRLVQHAPERFDKLASPRARGSRPKLPASKPTALSRFAPAQRGRRGGRAGAGAGGRAASTRSFKSASISGRTSAR